jgi:hypothetical protein
MYAFKLQSVFQHVILTAGMAFLMAACSQQPSIPNADTALGLEAASPSEMIASDLGWNVSQTKAVVGKHEKVLRSSIENRELTLVALPIYKGVSKGKPFWFVVTDASRKAVADGLGVNLSPKLELAKGTAAVQRGSIREGRLQVPATVDFTPKLEVVPGPNAFPPASFMPGSVGETGYSPLVELPNGVVLNASHVANASGVSDKVVAINYRYRYVVLKLAEGFYEDKEIYYVSLDSSGDLAASLENVNFAPNLNAAPGLDSNDVATSARSGIALFVNGQTGKDNPNRQGLRSALLGEGGPNNTTQSFPLDELGVPEPDYSPLWDAHVGEWSAAAVSAGQNTRQGDFAAIEALAAAGTLTAPGGGAWGASGFIVNCPVVSIDR